jgi:hypothetical protein
MPPKEGAQAKNENAASIMQPVPYTDELLQILQSGTTAEELTAIPMRTMLWPRGLTALLSIAGKGEIPTPLTLVFWPLLDHMHGVHKHMTGGNMLH